MITKAQVLKHFQGSYTKVQEFMGYKSVQAVYQWPDILGEAIRNKVHLRDPRAFPLPKPKGTNHGR